MKAGKRKSKKGADDRTGGPERKLERQRGGETSFFPADPLPLLHHPPRPLPLWAARWPGWAQTALLPVSMLALLARPNTKQQ